ncbi:outer membrane beta-barrel domain-containing protein [Aliikangiella coralliicola]|uniref:Outer membrane beta-barrel domain-containing protein n=1 Tax=Aliikangiella coralliicola TaxID=2592383 RepID=A0A545U015_9GAMM|nr:outer membrane beta-barrel domain-containing protein [Aliikangiella coralliicola]TQV82804.1 outer membrane beta-barrel domain-containing protein [Aliikangiella coralliicola]
MSNYQHALKRITLFLFCTFSLQHNVKAEEPISKDVKIIKPKKDVVTAKAAAIDTEKFELGLLAGFLAVEDFDSNLTQGINFTYHINQDFIVSLESAQSKVGRATFEDVVDGDFLRKSDETFKYTSVSAGYKLFHGRSFLSKESKYDSNIYFLLGVSEVKFAGNSETGLVIGTSYKTVLTDWLTWDLSIKDHVVNRDFLADDKRTHNIEMSLGLNLLF